MIEDANGRLHPCVARKSAGRMVCGDRVEWMEQPDGTGIVTAVLPRKTLLERCDEQGKPRPMCADVDQLVIVAAVHAPRSSRDRPLSHGRDLIDCYLAAAEILGIEAIIVVNKIDLLPGDFITLDATLEPYRAAGYAVFLTSALTGQGIAESRERLRIRRSVLVGESGVGKSSLIKTLLPDRDIRIGELAAVSGKGRHTTTTTVLFHLPEGGDIIDSPGVREFGLWNVAPRELASGFREFQNIIDCCRYRDCRHLAEPGCAVPAAVAKGVIHPERLDAYRRILRSLLDHSASA